MKSTKSNQRQGFTLVELLVVIGIIALLIAMLMPALSKAQAQARAVACMSNLRQLGLNLQLYGDQYRGWIFPVGAWATVEYESLGSNKPPHERWPMAVFKFSHPPLDPTPTYNPTTPGNWDTVPDAEIKPWTPAVLTCPADQEPRAAHSYVVNKLLVKDQQELLKFGGKSQFKSNTEIVVAGEKTTIASDYYMEVNILTGSGVDEHGNPITEFARVIEQTRHGVNRGSNYLFFDGHVELIRPKESKDALNPWILTNPAPPTP